MKKVKNKPVLWWKDQETGERKGVYHYASMNSFYSSPPWRRLRSFKLSQDPFCERCQERNITVPAEEVHHINPIDLRPDLALEISNLESLCKTCHSSETASTKNAKKKGGIMTYAKKHNL